LGRDVANEGKQNGNRNGYRFCANAAQKACNWLVETSSPGGCLSCRHTLECAECGDDPPEEFLNDQKGYLFAPLGCLQL
jgi:hypothetical protein